MTKEELEILGGQVVLREGSGNDESFIYSSWLRSYRASKVNSAFSTDLYYERQTSIIDQILPRSSVIVACGSDDLDHIYGYLVFDKPHSYELKIHYIYVKQAFRHMGIGRALLAKASDDVLKLTATHFPANEGVAEAMRRKEIVYVG